MVSPVAFFKLGLEDNALESLSALMWFIAAGTMVAVVIRLRRRKVNSLLFKLAAAALAFIFFVIGMKEVSWFQRVLEFETPEALLEPPDILEGNLQGEANLHNLSTTFFENVFYFSMYVFFVLLPFARDRIRFIRGSKLMSFYIPGYFMVAVGSVQVAFNYDMWNGILIQFSFFTTILVLWRLIAGGRSENHFPVTLLCVAVTLVLAQVAFLSLGHNFVRLWDVTEYKEFFIALAGLVYSIEVLKKARDFEFTLTA